VCPVASVAVDVFENSFVPKADIPAIDRSRHPKLVVTLGWMIRMIGSVLNLQAANLSSAAFNSPRYEFEG
jgi:hypothetical protein